LRLATSLLRLHPTWLCASEAALGALWALATAPFAAESAADAECRDAGLRLLRQLLQVARGGRSVDSLCASIGNAPASQGAVSRTIDPIPIDPAMAAAVAASLRPRVPSLVFAMAAAITCVPDSPSARTDRSSLNRSSSNRSSLKCSPLQCSALEPFGAALPAALSTRTDRSGSRTTSERRDGHIRCRHAAPTSAVESASMLLVATAVTFPAEWQATVPAAIERLAADLQQRGRPLPAQAQQLLLRGALKQPTPHAETIAAMWNDLAQVARMGVSARALERYV